MRTLISFIFAFVLLASSLPVAQASCCLIKSPKTDECPMHKKASGDAKSKNGQSPLDSKNCQMLCCQNIISEEGIQSIKLIPRYLTLQQKTHVKNLVLKEFNDSLYRPPACLS